MDIAKHIEKLYETDLQKGKRMIASRLQRPFDSLTVEDLFHEALLGILRRVSNHRDSIREFNHYFITVIRNTVNKHLGVQKKQTNQFLSIELEDIMATELSLYQLEMEEEDFWEFMKKNYSDEEITILKMRFSEGLSYREIGYRQGISESCANQRVLRIFDRTRKYKKEIWGVEGSVFFQARPVQLERRI